MTPSEVLEYAKAIGAKRDLLDTWLYFKRRPAAEIRLRLHPHEFALYFDVQGARGACTSRGPWDKSSDGSGPTSPARRALRHGDGSMLKSAAGR